MHNRELGAEGIFEEIMSENFPNLTKVKKPHIQEIQKVLRRINAKTSKPKHIINLSKSKENYESSKRKVCTSDPQ